MAIKSVGSRWSVVVGQYGRGLCLSQRQTTNGRLKLFDRYLVIGIDAHFARNIHCLFGNLAGGELRVVGQRLRGGLGIRTSAANGGDAAVGLDDISLAAEQERLLLVADN